MRKAGPQNQRPHGAGVPGRPGERPAGQALAHRSRRPALSSVRRLRAGAGCGEESGEQRSRQGGVHPAGTRGKRGPSWAAPPRPGGEPPAGHGGSSGARGSSRGMLGALWGVAGRPCWTWGSLWGGAPSVARGGPFGAGPPSPRRSAPRAEHRGSESARRFGGERRSWSCVSVQARAGLPGQYRAPGAREAPGSPA